MAGWLRIVDRLRLERADLVLDQPADLLAGEHLLVVPVAVGVQRHVFDEPQLEAVLAGKARQRHDLLFGEAANGHRVELDLAEADLLGREDPGQHAVQSFAAGDLLEHLRLERIEADVQPPQAGVLEGLGLLRQQHAVGGQGDVANARHAGELADQPVEAVPHQRLAAGEPQLVDAHRRHDAHEAFDLLEREDLAARLEAHVLGRHAVEAADIAAIGDADPQVRVDAAEGVDERGSE